MSQQPVSLNDLQAKLCSAQKRCKELESMNAAYVRCIETLNKRPATVEVCTSTSYTVNTVATQMEPVTEPVQAFGQSDMHYYELLRTAWTFADAVQRELLDQIDMYINCTISMLESFATLVKFAGANHG